MLTRIQEFRRSVEIVGFKNVRISDVQDFLSRVNQAKHTDADIQFFDAGLVATWQHLYFAVLNALTAFKNKSSISKSVAMETLLYASGQHQISRATDIVGVKLSSHEIAVLIIGTNAKEVESTLESLSQEIGGKNDDSVLDLSESKRRAIQHRFDISSEEIAAAAGKASDGEVLVKLVLERVALLATQR